MIAMGGRAAWAIAAIFAVFAIVDVIARVHLHDEGILTWTFAMLARAEPMATLMLQKSRPPLAAVYAPIAGFGITAFAIAHALVAAAGVAMIAALARSLGHRHGTWAALALATSPLYFASACAGVGNSDGVVVAIAAAWLWRVRQRPFAAGLVLGVLPWIRAELFLLVVATAVVALAARERRFLLGLAALPALYGISGAIYHHDALWMLHFPPALPEPMADNPYWAQYRGAIALPQVVASLAALGPILWLAPLVRPGRMDPLERAWGYFAMFELGLLLALPRWQTFNFDLSPRYLLGVVPVAALLLSRVMEDWELGVSSSGRRIAGETAWVAASGAAGVASIGVLGHPGIVVACGLLALVLASAHARAVTALRILAAATVLVAIPAFDEHTGLRRDRETPELAEAAARIMEQPRWSSRPIVTNAPLLGLWLRRQAPDTDPDVRYLVQADQLYELVRLSNADVGQRAALIEGLRTALPDPPILPGELTPQHVPEDALFVLVDDARLSLVMPPERWDGRLRLLHAGLRVRVLEVQP